MTLLWMVDRIRNCHRNGNNKILIIKMCSRHLLKVRNNKVKLTQVIFPNLTLTGGMKDIAGKIRSKLRIQIKGLRQKKKKSKDNLKKMKSLIQRISGQCSRSNSTKLSMLIPSSNNSLRLQIIREIKVLSINHSPKIKENKQIPEKFPIIKMNQFSRNSRSSRKSINRFQIKNNLKSSNPEAKVNINKRIIMPNQKIGLNHRIKMRVSLMKKKCVLNYNNNNNNIISNNASNNSNYQK